MNTPRFSVIVPAFNRASSIRPTLSSVAEQTFQDWECIVVDDGSSDGEELQRVVSEMDDDRFLYIRRENGGGGAARNTGIFAAKGDYIAFLDSDDFFLPRKLEVFSEYLDNDPNVAFYAPTLVDRGVGKKWVRPDRGIEQGEDVGEYLFVHNQVIQTSTLVVKRSTAQRVPFDPSLRKGQDLDLCIRYAAEGILFRMLPEALTIWVDASELNRTSRHGGWEAPMNWLEKVRPILSKRAYFGYRANVLAYYMAGSKPFRAFFYIVQGWLKGGVPFSVCLRQFGRCYIPRSLYRKAVNGYVAIRGV